MLYSFSVVFSSCIQALLPGRDIVSLQAALCMLEFEAERGLKSPCPAPCPHQHTSPVYCMQPGCHRNIEMHLYDCAIPDKMVQYEVQRRIGNMQWRDLNLLKSHPCTLSKIHFPKQTALG